MSVFTFIALRYLRPKTHHLFLNFLSFVSLIGIFVSVSAFLIIHSVMNGFSMHLKKALVGFDAHVVISSSKEIEEDRKILSLVAQSQEVLRSTPVIEFDGLMQTPEEETVGARFRGLPFENLVRDQNIKIHFFEEEAHLNNEVSGLPGVLVGEDLYARLKFMPGSHEVVTVINPFGDVGPAGEIEPRRKDFKIVGVVSTGFYDFDTRYVLMNTHEAARLASLKTYSSILVMLKNDRVASLFASQFRQEFPQIKVSTWSERNKRLFKALQLERTGMFLLLSVVTLIASFNVMGLMSLLAMGKKRDAALFYALGLPLRELRKIFYRMGMVLGLGGCFLGLAAGLLILGLLTAYPLPLPPAYYLDHLPVKIDWRVFILLAVMAPAFSMLASLWPAYRMGRVRMVKTLMMG